MSRRRFPDGHPLLATSLDNLAGVLRARDSLHALALVLKAGGDLAGAEAQFREAFEMRKRLVPSGNLDVAQSLNSLAVLLEQRGDVAAAEPLSRESLALRRRLFPGKHTRVATGLVNLAGLLVKRGEMSEAEVLYREAVRMYESLPAAANAEKASARYGLGVTLWRLRRFVEAEPELLAAEPLMKDQPGQYKTCLRALVRFYESWHQAEPGKGHDAEATQWQARLEAAK